MYNALMLKIITAPNDILSQQAKPVVKIDYSIRELINEMKQTLLATIDPEGVGLAAPQIGKNLQIFITRPKIKSPITVFINPVIQARGDANEERKKEEPRVSKKKKDAQLEGCLSLPSIWGEVKRSQIIELSYLDENGKPHKRKFSGFIATIIQHEYDHLNGILFPKRVLEQKGKLYKSKKDEKSLPAGRQGKDVFEEIEI